MAPGTNCDDAPVSKNGRSGWFLNGVGDGFVVLTFGGGPEAREISFGKIRARVAVVGSDLIDDKGVLAGRYDGQPGTTYLIRPDQHVAARWRDFDPGKIEKALARAVAA
jgi:3-(3-hydroxy-phenyl)propionate hydroxylase